MKKLKTLAVATIMTGGLLIGGQAAMAQTPSQKQPQQQMQQQPQQKVKTNYSDKQLKAFINADKKLEPVQQKSQEKMKQSIKDAGLSVDRFNEIAQQKQSGKKGDVSSKESVAFNTAVQKVMNEKNKTDARMQDIIKNEGFDVQTFQEIAMAYQQSPELQKKINGMLKQQK